LFARRVSEITSS